jgi:glycosyltransferase involved in cell wall biosynthesis
MRIALVAPPMLQIPPRRYAGTERVVAALGDELHRRGHEVTLFASGDSVVDYELVPTVARALWPAGVRGDISRFLDATVGLVEAAVGRFDIVHSHLETAGLALTRAGRTPVLSTFHGRLDTGDTPTILGRYHDAPLVAISASQRRWFPGNRWVATIPHGLPSPAARAQAGHGDYLALVGRATREKGIAEAIELAGRSGRKLVLAAKAHDLEELGFVGSVIQPAVQRGIVDFLGEVSAPERDEVLAGAFATLMLGAWPEPFGLVAIESMARGTPVIARRAGALPEIIEHGVDGFLVDDLDEAMFALEKIPSLDRLRIGVRTRHRFSVERMTDDYEHVYRALICDPEAPLVVSEDDAVMTRSPDNPSLSVDSAERAVLSR